MSSKVIFYKAKSELCRVVQFVELRVSKPLPPAVKKSPPEVDPIFWTTKHSRLRPSVNMLTSYRPSPSNYTKTESCADRGCSRAIAAFLISQAPH